MIPNRISCLFLLLLCACGHTPTDSRQPEPLPESSPAEIRTAPAEKAPSRSQLTLSGKVIADPDRTVTYTPWVSGIAGRVLFSLGDRVEQGQPLVELRSQELTSLQAESATLEKELQVAERELAAACSLAADGMLSQRELLQAEADVQQARSALEKTQADMALFGTGNAEGAFTVRAPRSGFVIAKNISPGSTVSDGEPLFSIADLSSVLVEANVYAGDLSRIRQGMPVGITAIAYPGRVFPGTIDRLSQVFDPEDKSLKAFIRISDPEQLLKPEMSVITTVLEEGEQALVRIPSDAVIFDDDRYFVVLAGEELRYTVREIVPASRTAEWTYLQGGIAQNERIVTRNQLLIYSELKGE